LDKKTTTPYERGAKDAKPATTDDWLSTYYWRLEQLLDRVERANTHYQVLDLSRSATNDQINQAYRQNLTLLNPAYKPSGFNAPGEMQKRLKQAMEKVTLAGSVLLNFGKRVEYDNSLTRRRTAPLTVSMPVSSWKERPPARPLTTASQEQAQEKQSVLARDPKTVLREDHQSLQPMATQAPVGMALATEKTEENRRRGRRLKLSLPVYVTIHDRSKGESREAANTVDISRFGVAIQMRTRIAQGTVVHLTLPLPVKFRSHGYTDHSYNVYAIVRRVQPPKEGVRIVGVEFLGEHPPAGYLQQPWGTFQTTKWLGANRRREPRQVRAESVGVEYLDAAMQPMRSEAAFTEDISRSGVRLVVKTAPSEFDYVKVTNLARNTSSVAAVCNRYLGKDGFERLCLNFIDTKQAF
jgi:hypothetical protein